MKIKYPSGLGGLICIIIILMSIIISINELTMNRLHEHNVIRIAIVPLISLGILLMCIYWWANE